MIKLGTETNLGGTEMKLGTSEIHTINKRQGSSMKGTEILSKTEVTGKLSPESNYNLGIEFTEITQESRVFNTFINGRPSLPRLCGDTEKAHLWKRTFCN